MGETGAVEMAKAKMTVAHGDTALYDGSGQIRADRQRHFGTWAVTFRMRRKDAQEIRHLIGEEVTVTIEEWRGAAYIADVPLDKGEVSLVGTGPPPPGKRG